MLSLHTREMMYLPEQLIAQRDSISKALVYVSRGQIEASYMTLSIIFIYFMTCVVLVSVTAVSAVLRCVLTARVNVPYGA